MTTQTQAADQQAATNATMPDIPAALKRTTKTAAHLAPQPDAAKAAAKIAAKHNQTAKPADATKATKPASSVLRDALKGAAAVVVARSTGKAKPAHKPTTIARTEDNPAKSIVPKKFKAIYAENNDTNGAKLNLTLKAYTTTKNKEGRDALNLDLLREVAKDNGIDFSRYEHLNNGQKRMNVGNKLAGLLKAGKSVQIGKQRFADADKALAKTEQAAA